MTADQLTERLIAIRRKYKAEFEEGAARDARARCIIEELKGLGVEGFGIDRLREPDNAYNARRAMWDEVSPLISEFMGLK